MALVLPAKLGLARHPHWWRIFVSVIIGSIIGYYFIREIRIPLAVSLDAEPSFLIIGSIRFSLMFYPLLGSAVGIALYAIAKRFSGVRYFAAVLLGVFVGEYWYQEEPIFLGELSRPLLYGTWVLLFAVAALLLKGSLEAIGDQPTSQKARFSVLAALAGMLLGYIFYFEASPVWLGIGLVSQFAHIAIGGYLGILGLRLLRNKASSD